MMGALPQSSARPFNRKLGFVYAKYFANHRHNAALPRSYFLDQLCQADRRENPKPVACRRLRRTTPASPPPFLYGLLQRRENTSIFRQGCAGPTGRSGHRAYSSDSNSRRITPSLCSDLISDKDTVPDGVIATASRDGSLCDATGPRLLV